jgi:hypothetical protein
LIGDIGLEDIYSGGIVYMSEGSRLSSRLLNVQVRWVVFEVIHGIDEKQVEIRAPDTLKRHLTNESESAKKGEQTRVLREMTEGR